jgi:hypothetical protein
LIRSSRFKYASKGRNSKGLFAAHPVVEFTPTGTGANIVGMKRNEIWSKENYE